MSRTSTLILLGILVILTPFSGLPIAIRSLLAVVLGAGIASIGLSLRTREVRDMQSSVESPSVISPPTPPSSVSPI
ncbi:hypothetical protein EXS57_02845 [Candidatus Kaiserbacteria bacterium]|nr:hypothetical protein [Candidatus Kaiserbacteria bacterium]